MEEKMVVVTLAESAIHIQDKTSGAGAGVTTEGVGTFMGTASTI